MAPLRSGQQAACGWPGPRYRAGVLAAVPLLLLGYVSRAERGPRAERGGGRELWP